VIALPLPHSPMAAAPVTPDVRRHAADAEPTRGSSAKKLLARSITKREVELPLKEYDAGTIGDLAIITQYTSLAKTCPRGVYVLPDEEDFRLWHGVCFVPLGLIYGGSVVSFRLHIAPGFPDDGAFPTIVMEHRLRHPLIDREVSSWPSSKAGGPAMLDADWGVCTQVLRQRVEEGDPTHRCHLFREARLFRGPPHDGGHVPQQFGAGPRHRGRVLARPNIVCEPRTVPREQTDGRSHGREEHRGG
jgi:hypothetical protein